MSGNPAPDPELIVVDDDEDTVEAPEESAEAQLRTFFFLSSI
jgi:hypothetical protein